MRLTEELIVSKHLWFMWAVLGPYRPTQLQAYEVFFLQPDSESMCPASVTRQNAREEKHPPSVLGVLSLTVGAVVM